MGGIVMKCKELMVGDLVTGLHRLPMKITNVDDDYAYAHTYGDIWNGCEFDDEDNPPVPIPLTPEILEKNGWKQNSEFFMEKEVNENTHLSWTDRYGAALYKNTYHICDCNYVHILQHALRLCGLDELADNFKL